MQPVTFLKFVDNMIAGYGSGRQMRDCLMRGRIECLADCFHCLNAKFCETARQLLEGQIDALNHG